MPFAIFIGKPASANRLLKMSYTTLGSIGIVEIMTSNYSEDTKSNDEQYDFNDIKQHDETSPENTFDETIVELMKHIKSHVPSDCDAVIIIRQHDSTDPVVLVQGHPFDVTSMTATFVRRMKSTLVPELET